MARTKSITTDKGKVVNRRGIRNAAGQLIVLTSRSEGDLDALIMPEPNTGCHLWAGASHPFGYGFFGQVPESPQVKMAAHRLAWIRALGAIPDSMWVLHRCDVPACVNPDHLFLGDALMNNRDKVRKGRGLVPHAVLNRAKTHCVNGHAFTLENTYLRPESLGRKHRLCKACRDARLARYSSEGRYAASHRAVAV